MDIYWPAKKLIAAGDTKEGGLALSVLTWLKSSLIKYPQKREIGNYCLIPESIYIAENSKLMPEADVLYNDWGKTQYRINW
jgi:hypothetical protein